MLEKLHLEIIHFLTTSLCMILTLWQFKLPTVNLDNHVYLTVADDIV